MQSPLSLSSLDARARDGARLRAFVSTDAPGAPTVLLVNDPALAHTTWRRQVDYLRRRFRLVLHEYRGLFDGAAAAPEPATPVDDLEAVLDATQSATCSIVAWGLGAQPALALAARLPARVERVALLTPSFAHDTAVSLGLARGRRLLRPTPGVARIAAPLVHNLRALAVTSDLAPLLRRMGLAAPTLDDEAFTDAAASIRDVDVRGFFRLLASFGAAPPALDLASFPRPLLVVVGERDRRSPVLAARQIARRAPLGEVFVVRGAGHYAPLEYPELINLRLERFLEAVR